MKCIKGEPNRESEIHIFEECDNRDGRLEKRKCKEICIVTLAITTFLLSSIAEISTIRRGKISHTLSFWRRHQEDESSLACRVSLVELWLVQNSFLASASSESGCVDIDFHVQCGYSFYLLAILVAVTVFCTVKLSVSCSFPATPFCVLIRLVDGVF
jgi:hypothetical protein